jgi:capsular exopolysaccharide synthesis family protein
VSRFYEAMRRALEQQAEPRTGQEDRPSQTAAPADATDATDDASLPFDQDATTPVRQDPPNEFEEFLRAQPTPDLSSVELLPAPTQLRLAAPPPARPLHPVDPSYERIIQRLLAFRGGRRQCCLPVASSVPGEGASTVARNVAMALSRDHRGRVVLVDANLRAPNQHEVFQTGAADGLADVLSGDVALSAAVREVPEFGLAVLPSGRRSDSSSHVMTVSGLRGVVTALQSQFDWVVLDGPPVTTYAEASSLAAVADGAILVLRAERTRSAVAEHAIKVLNEAGVAVLGGVLNRRRYHIPRFIYKRM